MKLNKKKVFVVSLVISVIAILSLGSLAWFNAKDEVVNKFLTADSTDTDADDVFSIDVWELVDTDEDGTDEEVGKGDTTENTATYDNVVPGDTLRKEPKVTNTGDYDQWVRVYITISDAADWKALVPAAYDLTQIFTPVNNFDSLWKLGEVLEANDELTYVYYLQDKLVPNAEVGVFTEVNIPTWLTQDEMFELGAEGFNLTIKAEALQADNTGDSAEAAFAYVGWDAGETYEQSQQ